MTLTLAAGASPAPSAPVPATVSLLLLLLGAIVLGVSLGQVHPAVLPLSPVAITPCPARVRPLTTTLRPLAPHHHLSLFLVLANHDAQTLCCSLPLHRAHTVPWTC